MLRILKTGADNIPTLLGDKESVDFIIKIAQTIAEMQTAATSIPEPEVIVVNEKQLSERLTVSRQCLVIWRKRGKIPFIQIGSLIRYDLMKVLAALEVNKSKKLSSK